MRIVLPWPDKRLSPNARVHWRAKAPVKVKARADATLATYAALECGLRDVRQALSGEGPLPVTVTFYPPDRRHRDDDNMIGAFKSLRDGIADALGVNDRRFRPQYVFADPVKPGKIEVVFPSKNDAAAVASRAAEAQNENGPSECGNTQPEPDHDRCLRSET